MRNSGHGMMDAFNMSWKEAGAGADLESANLAGIRVLPVTKGGAYYRTEVTKDQEGKDVSRRVMNTVEVRDVTGKVHNVPLSYGLNSTRRNDGNYELTLAGRVDESRRCKINHTNCGFGRRRRKILQNRWNSAKARRGQFCRPELCRWADSCRRASHCCTASAPFVLTLCGAVRFTNRGFLGG
jgi:hypothetical protein